MSVNQKIKEFILGAEKFGFKYYGLDENRKPLFQHQNGQVLNVSDVLNHINNIVNSRQDSDSSGPESMPNSSNSIESKEGNLEISNENIEKKENVDKVASKNPGALIPTHSPTEIEKKAPKIDVYKKNIEIFSAGHLPSFDLADNKSVDIFIKKNTAKPRTSSNKWLASKLSKLRTEIENGLLGV